MNFLLRSSNTPPPPPKKTLEGLIAEDPLIFEGDNAGSSRSGDEEASVTSGGAVDAKRSQLSYGGIHSDVSDGEGWIAITCKELPKDWSNASDICSFRSLDRSFVFPGEQLHVLACLATSMLDTEVISSSGVSGEMSMSGSLVENNKQEITSGGNDPSLTNGNADSSHEHQEGSSDNTIANGEVATDQENLSAEEDFSTNDGLFHNEGRNYQPEMLLERFKSSHFFVRIAESSETLWSKRSKAEAGDAGSSKTSSEIFLNTNIDNGKFHGLASGGLVRDIARCYSLGNGDIVVLLQVNVGTYSLQDPVLEVLQFEKSRASHVSMNRQASLANEDPNGELLRWLFPLDNARSPLPLLPSLGSSLVAGGGYHRPTLSSSSPGSQLLSFGNFRSYSMPSLPQPTTAPDPTVTPPSYLKHRSILENSDHFSSEKLVENQDVGVERHLSFRSVQLEPEQLIVHCGLEGIYLPGKRWKKRIEIVQPMEIHSYAADCNTDNLLCVQIKNVCPAHIPDIIIYLDAISIVFEESPESGQLLSLPVSFIETGSSHSLSSLSLRRGEEHSFIVKPLMLTGRFSGDKSSDRSNFQAAPPGSNMPKIRSVGTSSHLNKYSVLVSYRCNYAESKLFLKKTTNWCPHVAKDLMISVASEMSKEDSLPEGRDPQLPVQVLTLQASNLTSEDLTLMVLAPASSTAAPSVVSLNSSPTTPVGPMAEISEYKERPTDKDEDSCLSSRSIPVPRNQQDSINLGIGASVHDKNAAPSSEKFPDSGGGATHLWLQSRVPIGCVPAQSCVSVKLRLLPLTDGAITLDTLQVAIKEKGAIYTPEGSLKINATSSIATGIS